MTNISSQLKKGSTIVLISRYSAILLQIGLTSILSRLLTPKEFGTVAIVSVFVTFFSMLSEMGIGVGVVQEKSFTERDLSSLFSITIIISFILFILFFVFSYLIALFYEDPIYIKIGQLLSLSLFFTTLSTVPLAILRKKMEFLKIGIIQFISLCVSGVIGILCAINGLSYYSIIIQSIVNSFILSIVFIIFSKIKFSLKFNLYGLKKIFRYSSYQFLFNFINYFSRNLDNLLIGRILGPAQLGFYDKAYKLMLYPVNNLTGIIASVLHPVFSDYQNDKKKIYFNYLNIVNLLLFLGIPLSVLFYFSSEEIILILFGESWKPSIPIFKILSCAVWVQVVLSSSGAIFQASGRTNLLFLNGILSNFFIILGLIVGLNFGLTGVSIGIVIAFYIIFFPSFFILINKALEQSILPFLKLLIPNFVVGLFNIIFVKFFEVLYGNVIVNNFLSLLLKTVITVIILIFSYFLYFNKRKRVYNQ